VPSKDSKQHGESGEVTATDNHVSIKEHIEMTSNPSKEKYGNQKDNLYHCMMIKSFSIK
jgi:hypothetical protein